MMNMEIHTISILKTLITMMIGSMGITQGILLYMVGVIPIHIDIIVLTDIILGMMIGVITDMDITIPIIGDTIIILTMVMDGVATIIPRLTIKKDHSRKEAVLSEIHPEVRLDEVLELQLLPPKNQHG
jgi:hypothetical protein